MSGLDASSSSLTGVVIAFVVLQSLGAVLLAGVLLTLLCSSTIQRSALWFNVNFSFLLLALSYLMLGIFGELGGPQPDTTICLSQAALIQAVTPMAAATVLAMLIQVWLSVTQPFAAAEPTLVKFSLICSPYSLFILILLEAFLVGNSPGGGVERRPGHPYCSFRTYLPSRISEIVIVLLILAAMVFLGLTIFRLYRRRFAKAHPARAAAVDFVIRMGVYAALGIVGVVIFLATLHGGKDAARGEALSTTAIGTFPLVSCLILGTRKDIIMTWLGPCLGNRVGSEGSDDQQQAEVDETPWPPPKRSSIEKVDRDFEDIHV